MVTHTHSQRHVEVGFRDGCGTFAYLAVLHGINHILGKLAARNERHTPTGAGSMAAS